jgi:hypothetical protein
MTLFNPGPATRALVGNVVRHPSPPGPIDPAAFSHLYAMLFDEATALAALPARVVAVGAAPDKFNDAGWGQWWFARADSEVAQADSYFSDRKDFERAVAAASPTLKAVAASLERLERHGWRQWWLRAYGLPLREELLALIVQDGAPWFAYATSNSGDRDHAFSLWQEPTLVYFGECAERLDDALDDGPMPLQLLLAEGD